MPSVIERLTWAGLAPADRASFGWRLLIRLPRQRAAESMGYRKAERLDGLEVHRHLESCRAGFLFRSAQATQGAPTLEMLWLVKAGHYGSSSGLVVTQDRGKEQANNSGRIPG
jgi:hypothetical protein